jgi:hypothetical protein
MRSRIPVAISRCCARVVQVALQPLPLGDRPLDEASPPGAQTESHPAHLDRDGGGGRQRHQTTPCPG